MTHSKKVSKDNNISLDFYQQIGEEYKVAYLGENSFVWSKPEEKKKKNALVVYHFSPLKPQYWIKNSRIVPNHLANQLGIL